MSNIRQKNREKEIAREAKKILSEKYPNLFNYLSDLENKKQIPFSDYDWILPFNHPLNKNE